VSPTPADPVAATGELQRDAVPWWRRGIVYQIYPRSFQDSNGDGIGDLPGIIARLDYLKGLGVDALWLSPIHPSPMADFGYDVSDYTAIDPVFGTLSDCDRLIAEAHRRGLKVLLDFVANHTSDRHPWFVDSRSARTAAKRDWYIWRDPAPNGGPPNNWLGEFGGPAWTFDRATGQYYYHAYLAAQPDLNWRNPRVREAMYAVLRFWFERGVDGFRIDAAHRLIEDAALRDNPPNPDWRPGMPPTLALQRLYTSDQPELHEIFAELRRIADSYGDRVLIGEAYLPLERLVRYYGVDLAGLQLPFNFHLIGALWRAPILAELIRRYEALLPPGAWPNWVLGNHDRSRVASRLGRYQARVAAVLLLTLRGTPTLYYGDELGLEDVPIPPERVQDPWGKNLPGFGLGRDPVRTPMPWTGAEGGGFTTGDPWLPFGPDLASRNVMAEERDPGSMLWLYRRLIALRRHEPALSLGAYGAIEAAGEVLRYERVFGPRRLFVLLNLGDREARLSVPGDAALRIALSSEPERTGTAVAGEILLRPAEGVVLAPAA
jgi:alpha-glucosidase